MTIIMAITGFLFLAFSVLLNQVGFLATLILIGIAAVTLISIICAVAMFVIDVFCEPDTIERV